MITDAESFADLIAQIEKTIDDDLMREIKDSHDYSSSDYSAHDDGYNEGVGDATAAFRATLASMIKKCGNCHHDRPFAEGDYICIYCREEGHA